MMEQFGKACKCIIITIVVFAIVCYSSTIEEDQGHDVAVIYRTAMGRQVSLGETYDATNDKLLKRFVFTGDIEEKEYRADERIDCYSNIDEMASMIKTESSFFVGAELSLSIMMGLITAGAHGSYSSDIAAEELSNRTRLVGRCTTEINTLLYTNPKLVSKLNKNVLMCSSTQSATHFVSHIIIGGEVRGYCDAVEYNSADGTVIKGGVNFGVSVPKASGSVNVESSHADNSSVYKMYRNLTMYNNFKIKLSSDRPDDIYGFKEAYNKMFDFLHTDKYKGIPIGFYLSPIHLLDDEMNVTCSRKKYTELSETQTILINSINKDLLKYGGIIDKVQVSLEDIFWVNCPQLALSFLKIQMAKVIQYDIDLRAKFRELIRRNRLQIDQEQAIIELNKFRELNTPFSAMVEILYDIIRTIEICTPSTHIDF